MEAIFIIVMCLLFVVSIAIHSSDSGYQADEEWEPEIEVVTIEWSRRCPFTGFKEMKRVDLERPVCPNLERPANFEAHYRRLLRFQEFKSKYYREKLENRPDGEGWRETKM